MTPYLKAISGSFGGIVEASCLQPIDVIKTRLQLDRSGNYKGILHCGTMISRTEGVRALWKGMTPFATHLTLKYALRMGSNAVLQSAFKDPQTGKVSSHGRFLSGFGAGVLEALIIVTPFEVSAFYLLSCVFIITSSQEPFHVTCFSLVTKTKYILTLEFLINENNTYLEICYHNYTNAH
ncbi:putative mitochondrial carrier domain-containing protein [Lupinus albus]|uniref:Putative mitochondrial carrier domain-containing protein n=1 Tax=Lupinus albus TaxID=3870 RepID=A0A6A4NQZ7_LUPAL|nr:putative mitochondrial carrier domain-containing protein [Lupinus albus]